MVTPPPNSILPQGNLYLSVGGVFTALAGVAVILRLLSKRVTQASYGPDDWLVVIGYCVWLCEESVTLSGVTIAMKATSFTAVPGFQTFTEYLYVATALYFPTTTFARLSIIFFYRRIFSTTSFRRISMIFIIVCIVFAIPVSVLALFLCYPTEQAWAPASLISKCIPFNDYFIVSISLELGLDASILILPLKQIYKLQMSFRQKLMLSGIFVLSGFELITGILRVVITLYAPAGAYLLHTMVTDLLWMSIHTGTLFVCVCLPTYRPLFVAAKSWASNLTSGSRTPAKSSQYSSNTTVVSASTASKSAIRRDYKEINDPTVRDDVELLERRQKYGV